MRARPRVLVAHPHVELYGSDRQMLESVTALTAAGWLVSATLPARGTLAAELEARGAAVHPLDVAVLRKSAITPVGLLRLGVKAAAVAPLVRLLRQVRPDVLYVSTLVAPSWVLAGRLARVPVVVHVHEAEAEVPRPLQRGLALPLLLARLVLTNSQVARSVLVDAVPSLRGRTRVVYNGVPGPDGDVPPPPEAPGDGPVRLVQVGRLSPRKGTDVTLEALRRLVADGHDVHLDLVGGVYAGYEWFERELRAEASTSPLAGRVTFHGFTGDIWPVVLRAHVALVPSRVEPFGNVAVEALLAHRPLVASSAQGLVEIVTDGVDGLLVAPEDPDALADAVARLVADWPLARRLAEQGRERAVGRFTPGRYGQEIVEALAETGGGDRRAARRPPVAGVRTARADGAHPPLPGGLTGPVPPGPQVRRPRGPPGRLTRRVTSPAAGPPGRPSPARPGRRRRPRASSAPSAPRTSRVRSPRR